MVRLNTRQSREIKDKGKGELRAQTGELGKSKGIFQGELGSDSPKAGKKPACWFAAKCSHL